MNIEEIAKLIIAYRDEVIASCDVNINYDEKHTRDALLKAFSDLQAKANELEEWKLCEEDICNLKAAKDRILKTAHYDNYDPLELLTIDSILERYEQSDALTQEERCKS